MLAKKIPREGAKGGGAFVFEVEVSRSLQMRKQELSET